MSLNAAFREYLILYKITAKQAIERMESLSHSEQGSIDERVLRQCMDKDLVPRLSEMGSVISSAILLQNAGSEKMPCINMKSCKLSFCSMK